MVQGVGGVGKTMLAIHVVRQRTVWEWYRDGVFWVDVERYEETSAIQWLAHQVAGKRALQAKDPWRTVAEALKKKRVLIVLDGIEEQIDLDRWADLLPQKGRLLVTTRGTAREGTRIDVRVLGLSGLTPDTARELLTRGVRVDVTEGELARVMDGLEYLPLALYIGNRIARLDGGLIGFIGDLREMGLEALELGSRKGENVRATFEVSYRRLNEEQTLFRGLGVFLPWFQAQAVATVLELSEGAAREEMKPMGLELPDWDWLVAEDDAAEEEPSEKHQEAVQS